VLWSILYVFYSSELVMRLHCKILLKKYYWNRPPRLTGWIHPCFSPFWKWILHRTGCLANRLRHKYDERFVTKDLNYELQLVSTVKCESSKARQKVWFQRSPNFKQMCSKIGLSKWGFRLISRFFFITGIDGVVPDRTILGLSGWAC